MTVFVTGAFSKFADANAAAEELRESGLAEGQVRVMTNPANAGGVRGTSRWPGTVEMLVRTLFDLNEKYQVRERYHVRRQRTKSNRRGVLVSIPVPDAKARSVARAVLHRHRAVELGNVPGGVPIY